MSNSDNHRANCLCGSVTVQVSKPGRAVEACHCSMCRTWGGGPLLAIEAGSDVLIEGSDHRSYASSEWAERGFCSRCGTHLYYLLKQNNEYVIPAGLLADLDLQELSKEIFVDEKPNYYCFGNQTTSMTGAEVFAQYAPTGE